LIIYVESNFVLEIALMQEQSSSANRILQLAVDGFIKLVIPSFSISEPYSTLGSRDRERKSISDLLDKQSVQLKRSDIKVSAIPVVEQAAVTLSRVSKAETDSLEDTTRKLLSAARQISIDRGVFEEATKYERLHGLKPKDSIVYASIISDLTSNPNGESKCFVTKDSKDFDVRGIRTELTTLNCQPKYSFDDTLRFIEHEIASQN